MQPITSEHECWQPFWGKSRLTNDGRVEFHRLASHALDVAMVGRCYLNARPAWVCHWAQRFGIEVEPFVEWLVFWLALHDLGKFAWPFQMLRPEIVRVLGIAPVTARLIPGSPRHDTFGSWACESIGPAILLGRATSPDDDFWRVALRPWIAAVVGHHGLAPAPISDESVSSFALAFPQHAHAAAQAWVQDARTLLLSPAAQDVWNSQNPDTLLELGQEFSWSFAGVAVLADWIGSNTDWFAYQAEPVASLTDYAESRRSAASRALAAAGVLPPRSPRRATLAQLVPSITEPSPLQRCVDGLALNAQPGMVMIEDVTGAGKTEAAALLAHRWLAAGVADGFYFALPTMATANAMYLRISRMLDNILPGRPSLTLAQSQARLMEAYTSTWVDDLTANVVPSGPPDQPFGSIGGAAETATAQCARWLTQGAKRALLAPVGVGTIDQALMAALRVRHQSLRLIGLARKVLIVDEVHACDPYVAAVLKVLLELHAQAGGSVILMSATLPAAMKQMLAQAYARGCDQRLPAFGASEPIPCLTHVQREASTRLQIDVHALDSRSDVARRLFLRYESSRALVMESLLETAAVGGCAAWICNTVADALLARAELRQREPNARVILFHARFALRDRLDIEARLLRRFGPNGGAAERSGWIIVATQVAEQSLDLDFDHIVSDIAPIDRLIQRAGRLRRHRRCVDGSRIEGPGADERGPPCLWIHGPTFVDDPSPDWVRSGFRGTSMVYADHAVLWQTVRVLQRTWIDMPGDARALIESVFGEGVDPPPGLQRSSIDAQGQASADRSIAEASTVDPPLGYASLGENAWNDDLRASSRLGEPTTDVFLARWDGQRLSPWRDDQARYAWSNSALRVPMRLIACEAPGDGADPPWIRAAEAVRQNEPAIQPHSVLLVLTRSGEDMWTGLAADARGNTHRWIYTQDEGLARAE